MDDASVRRVRNGQGDEPPLPLPPRARSDRPVGRLRPAHPDGLRLGRARGGGRGWPGRGAHLEPGRHGDALREHPAGRGEHLHDDQRHGIDPAGAVRGGRSQAGRAWGSRQRHDPERHSQGVHRTRHLHLPSGTVDAPGDGRLRVLRAGVTALEHHLDQRISHARGGRDGRPGARVHPCRCHCLQRGCPGARTRHRRIRRPAVILLRGLERAVRGGGQVPRSPPNVGADREGSLRCIERSFDDVPLPRSDGRFLAYRPFDRQQRRADDGPGAGRDPRRCSEPAHERPR